MTLQFPRQPHNVSNTYIVRKALNMGPKICNELKCGVRSSDASNRLITTGQHVEGVRQDFILHATKPASHL